MKMNISREWLERMAKLEEECGDVSIIGSSVGVLDGYQPNRVLFLDVDGVLNSENSWQTTCEGEGGERLDPTMCKLLIGLVAAVGCKICVSSAWRHCHYEPLIARLLAYGLPEGVIIGKTPNSSTGYRGTEISAWLEEQQPEVTSYVILDDSDDMRPHFRNLVQTTWKDGLTQGHCNEVVRRFHHQDMEHLKLAMQRAIQKGKNQEKSQ